MKIKNLYLRPLTLDDTNLIVKWRNDDSVRKNLFTQALITPESHKRYYKEYIDTKRCLQFVFEEIIREANTGNCSVPIGTAYLKNIDNNNQKALMGIFIGEGADRGKGFGKEAVQLVLKYGFERLDLHKIYLQIISNNEIAISLYKGVGFKEEGRLRDDYCRDGKYYDVVQMGILKSEFKVLSD